MKPIRVTTSIHKQAPSMFKMKFINKAANS